MQKGEFATVSWERDERAEAPDSGMTSPRVDVEGGIGSGNSNGKRRGSGGQLGHNPDALDMAGVGEATLECTVTNPIKENDGSKDAYVSYLVTTHVRPPSKGWDEANRDLDKLPLLPETCNYSSQTIYGLCISLEDSFKRISSLRGSAIT